MGLLIIIRIIFCFQGKRIECDRGNIKSNSPLLDGIRVDLLVEKNDASLSSEIS
jgi:hypothetical protein